MPAFGKDGMVNLNKQSVKENFKLVKPDGTVVMSCNCREQLEEHKKVLSQKLNCELNIVESKLECL